MHCRQERAAAAAKAAAEAAARRRSASPDELDRDRAVQEGQHPQSSMSVRLDADELQLVALRHGSLMQAMLYSPATVCSLELWSLRGKQRLAEFLAVIGCAIFASDELLVFLLRLTLQFTHEYRKWKSLEDVHFSIFIQFIGGRQLCLTAISPNAVAPNAVSPNAFLPNAISPNTITTNNSLIISFNNKNNYD